MRILIKRCYFVLLLLFALFLPFSAHAYTLDADESAIRVPMQEWIELKSNNKQLQIKLTELEMNLNMLQAPSTELVELLKKARSELEESKQKLDSSKASLESAELSQKLMAESLQELSKRIQEEREQQARTEKRLKRQRNSWIALAFVTLIYKISS